MPKQGFMQRERGGDPGISPPPPSRIPKVITVLLALELGFVYDIVGVA